LPTTWAARREPDPANRASPRCLSSFAATFVRARTSNRRGSPTRRFQTAVDRLSAVRREIAKVIVGQDDVVKGVLETLQLRPAAALPETGAV
jgi:hypothetical protein